MRCTLTSINQNKRIYELCNDQTASTVFKASLIDKCTPHQNKTQPQTSNTKSRQKQELLSFAPLLRKTKEKKQEGGKSKGSLQSLSLTYFRSFNERMVTTKLKNTV